MLSTNQVLNQGRYRIIHHVGSSDNSGLYQAYDTVSDTNVVLKETEGNAASAEAKALSELKHKSLLNVRDYFSELDRQYIVIESTDGQNLAESLAAGGKTPAVSDVVKWADNLLDALEYLHDHRPPVLHGDIKPENVRLTSSFEIKLLSPAASRGDDEFAVSAMDDTASLPYRSLEQLWESLDAASRKVIANSFDEVSEEILREEPDERADLYGLAATLYHAMTNVAPADAMVRTLEMLEGNDDPLQPANEVDAKIPKAVSEVLLKALEIKRENRFESASAMHSALRSAAADLTRSETNAASAAQAAEQKRLDEQRKAEEAKKLAAETEQKRLADEQAQVEQKRQKLEAEQKLRDEIAAQEKAAPKETVPLKEDLLELPEGVNAGEVQELDGADILAEAFDEKPKAKAASASHSSIDYNPMFSEQSSGGMSKMPLIIGGAVLALAAIVGGWMFMGSSSGSQATPAQTTVSADAAKTDAPAATEQAPQTTAPAAAIQDETPAAEPESKASSEQPAKNEAVKPQAKSRKEEKTEAKPTATPKKAVTADDIMHDN